MIRKSPAKEIESYYNQNPFNKSCFRKRCNEPNSVFGEIDFNRKKKEIKNRSV